MGVHAFNLTCTDIVFGASHVNWETLNEVATTTSGGTLRCHANLTAYAYTGLVYADVVVGPSSVVLTPGPSFFPPLYPCGGDERPYKVDTCSVEAAITNMYADPPSRLIDLALARVRAAVNDNIASYFCGVVVPKMQEDLEKSKTPYSPERNSSASKSVFPLDESDLAVAAFQTAKAALRSLLGQRPYLPDPSFFLSKERGGLSLLLTDEHVHFAHSLVAAAANATSMQWLQGVVDDFLSGTSREPYPVFGLPGEVTNLALLYDFPPFDFGVRPAITVRVDATFASCDGNACEVYLNPGVALGVDTNWVDGVAQLVANSVLPPILSRVNAKVAEALDVMAAAQQRDVLDPNATVRVSFGKKAVLRQWPRVWLLAVILACGVVGGAAMIRRNVRLHASHPVLSSATGEAVPVARLVREDVMMLVVATACLMLFAASNTMTGASVLLGSRLNTYSFSMWNTVSDLWGAGLVPLSICVLVFSGIYPYVKLLSLVYFTVWAQRPLSKRLAIIDILGKFSFIDTFALMVMVAGLEIRGIAKVAIHPGFYCFMFATIASIALGNFATTLYRRGTSHRVPEDGEEAAVEGGSGYERVATADVSGATVPPPPPPPPSAQTEVAEEETAQEAPSLLTRLWRRCCRRVSVLPFVVIHLCILPSWRFGCLAYDIGGLARLVTPAHKTLSLWQLSLLDKWGGLERGDAMVVSIFAVSIFTILLAPCLFALLPRQCPFLASWCAADVFVVACVAGLLQLHQFVTFVLGEGMDDVYTAHATLRWPMLPLTVAAVLVWALVAREVFGVTWPAKRSSGAAPASI